MAKFDYKKWITENKHGKNPFSSLYEQGVADFEIKEQTTGSNTGSGTSGTGSGTSGTGSGTTGGSTGSGTTGGSTGSGTTGSTTGSGTGSGGGSNPPTGSGTITCYGCQNGQIVTNSSNFFNSGMQGGTVCGTTSTGGVTTTWYGDQNDPGLTSCTTGGGTGNCSPNYIQGQTQANGNPLNPNQIFGMQTATQPPNGTFISNMTDGYNQNGCQFLQNRYLAIRQKMGGLQSSPPNGTSPYCDTANNMPLVTFQQGDNPKWQGQLKSKLEWLESFAPTGCNVQGTTANEIETFKLHEHRINKKTTKRALQNIIKEELRKSLLKEQQCQPTTPCGQNHQWSTAECKCVPLVGEQWNAEARRCDGPLLAWNSTECHECSGATPPYIGPSAYLTGPNCECCDEEPIITTGEGPCYDERSGEQVDCWYCKSNDCEQVGSFPYFTNADAVAAGVNLYLSKTLCNGAEDACGDPDPEPEECGCCCDYVTAQQAEQLGGTLGKPIGGPEPSPVDGCKPGSPTVPAVWSVTKHECICTDPSKPYLIPGSTQPCKGSGTPPTQGRINTEIQIQQSQRLREEITKELFGK